MDTILKIFKECSESFKNYKLDHSKCAHVGYSPDLINDLKIVQNLAMNKSLNNIVLNHLESYSGNTNEYVLILRLNSRGQYECIIDYSSSKRVSYYLQTCLGFLLLINTTWENIGIV